MPKHVNPTNSSPEDQFADTLDALTLGIDPRPGGDASLASAARSIGKVGLQAEAFPDNDSVTLDRATKRRIWADLMREHGGSTTASPVPQSPGTAGSTLAPNPWVARPDAKPKRTRPSTGVLRFIPAAQPTSTFLLVVAVLVLIGGTFASLAPNGGQGVISDASATEHPSQLAFTSPEASPLANECAYEPMTIEEIERIRETGGTQPPRDYTPAFTADSETTSSTRERLERIDACEGDNPALWWSMMTDRAVLESPLGVSSSSLERSREVSEHYGEALLGEKPSASELERFRETQRSSRRDFPFDSEIVHLMDPDLGVVRELPDGRLAIYSAEVWLRRDGLITNPLQAPDREIFQYTIFGNPEFGGGLDEPLFICLGECGGFWLDIANDTYVLPCETPPASPAATPESPFDYMQGISPADCTVDSRPLEEIRALQDDLGQHVERQYVPVVLADDGPTVEVPRAARTWRACSAYGLPLQRMAMESPRLIYQSGGNAVWDGATDEVYRLATDQLASEVLDDWTAYYVEAPVLGETANGSTTGYIPPDGRSFLLPSDVYQLPDGRVGGPVTTLVPPGYIEFVSGSSGQNVEFQIYAQDPAQGGRWVLDETLWLCPGGCDELYADIASPAASPVGEAPPVATEPQLTIATPAPDERQWLAPLRNESCPGSTPETSTATPAAPAVETDPAGYVPFVETAATDREAAATIYLRLVSGCEAAADQSLVVEGGVVILGAWDEAGTSQSQIDTAEAISEELGIADPHHILIASNDASKIMDDDGVFTLHPHRVLLPRDVVRLPDGRMGGMLRVQVLPGALDVGEAATTLFVVFELIDGEWALAESFSICVGQCQASGAVLERTGQSIATATPAASPVTTKR